MNLREGFIDEYIQARDSQLSFYKAVPLYRRNGDHFAMYKAAGITIGELRVGEGTHPRKLFIKQSDKLKGLQEAQQGFNKQLVKDVQSGDSVKIKETLVNVVEETLAEPRSGSLEGVADTVGVLVSSYAKKTDVLKNLIDLSSKDYSSTMHSINVMAMALNFAYYIELTPDESKVLGMCGLLHDVGKSKIEHEILVAPRKLTNEEFEEMQRHTIKGYYILKKCDFSNREIALTALNHHEKIDGSGYPNHIKQISKISQIVGIIDCYEAVTNDERPYRSAMEPFAAIDKIIKKEMINGKFDKELFKQFVKCLGTVFR